MSPLIILLTWGRGNWLGLLVGVAILLLMGRNLISSRRKLGAIGLALILLSVLLVGVQALAPKEIVHDRVMDERNIYGRFATWGLVFEEFRKHPIFGIGLNNLRNVLATESSRIGIQSSYKTEHNAFLALLAEGGIVSFLSYLAIAGSIFRSGLRLYRDAQSPQERWRGIIVISVLVAYLIPGLFASTLKMLGLSHVYVYLFLGGIVGLGTRQRSTANVDRLGPREGVQLEESALRFV